jgi:hypothetical protein
MTLIVSINIEEHSANASLCTLNLLRLEARSIILKRGKLLFFGIGVSIVVMKVQTGTDLKNSETGNCIRTIITRLSQ